MNMISDGNVTTTNWYTPDAWRTGQEPDAIMEALAMGEQVMGLLVQAAILIEEACQNVTPIIDNTTVRCQVIVDQLAREIARMVPILIRLRAASGAVMVS